MDNLFLVPVQVWLNKRSFWIANGTKSQLFPLFSDKEIDNQVEADHVNCRVINHDLWHKILPYSTLNREEKAFKKELLNDYDLTLFSIGEPLSWTGEMINLESILSAFQWNLRKTAECFAVLSISAKVGKLLWSMNSIDGIKDITVLGNYMAMSQVRMLRDMNVWTIVEQMTDLIGERPVKDLQRFFNKQWRLIAQKLYDWMSQEEKYFSYRSQN
jgi:hypothetical protein